MCHSQLYQMVDTCWLIAGIHRPMFSQCKVFALILYSRSRVDREVTMYLLAGGEGDSNRGY